MRRYHDPILVFINLYLILAKGRGGASVMRAVFLDTFLGICPVPAHTSSMSIPKKSALFHLLDTGSDIRMLLVENGTMTTVAPSLHLTSVAG